MKPKVHKKNLSNLNLYWDNVADNSCNPFHNGDPYLAVRYVIVIILQTTIPITWSYSSKFPVPELQKSLRSTVLEQTDQNQYRQVPFPNQSNRDSNVRLCKPLDCRSCEYTRSIIDLYRCLADTTFKTHQVSFLHQCILTKPNMVSNHYHYHLAHNEKACPDPIQRPNNVKHKRNSRVYHCHPLCAFMSNSE